MVQPWIFTAGVLYENLLISISEAVINEIPVSLENPCFVLPPDVCVEEAVYVAYVVLPPSPVGYDLIYQRCFAERIRTSSPPW